MNKENTQSKPGMQPSDYTHGPETLVWWSTPILRRTCEGHERVNEGLKNLVYDHITSGDGTKKSNEGGWHSEEDLLTWGGPAIAQLQNWIIEAFQDLTSAISGDQQYTGKLELNAWANVNQTSDYNVIHTHPACVWSGVYYVDAGTRAPDDRKKAGALEFLDPRAGAEMIVVPGSLFGRTRIEYPKTGDLVAFPSWLKHLVHPYGGQGDRISIAFNIRIRPNL